MKNLLSMAAILAAAVSVRADTGSAEQAAVPQTASSAATVPTDASSSAASKNSVTASTANQGVMLDVPEGSEPKVTATSKIKKPTAAAKDINLNQVPSLTTRQLLDMPKNLARWHMGAVLFIANDGPLQPFNWRDADSGQSPGLLLGDDPSAELDLTPDTYKFAIELNDYYLVNRFTFKNFSAIGTVHVFSADSMVNANSKAWKELAKPVQFDKEGYVSVRFEEVDTKNILIVFDVTGEGAIGIFGLYGDMSVAETRVPRTHQEAEQMTIASPDNPDTTKFNFGSVASGSKISHINKGDPNEVQKMNDDDVETAFEFPEDSEEDVMIIDLAEQQQINRISMLFESPPGTFDLYLTNDLPEGMEVVEEAPVDGTGEGERPSADASAAPADDDMAALDEVVMHPVLVLAANPGSLGEWLALATLAADPDATQVTLPKSFFENNEHAMQFEVDGKEGRFRADFEVIDMRYLIVRFVPAPGAPPGSGLRVYEIGLFGDVPEDRRRYVRVPVFEFFENAVDLSPELTPTTGTEDNGDFPGGGGGGLPQPPPVVVSP